MNFRKVSFPASLILIAAIAVSISATPFWEKKKEAAGQEQPADTGRAVPTTYLDSLNRGSEILLTPRDFAGSGNVPLETISAPPADKAEPFSGFRIQCVASSQAETIRAQKKDLETKVSYPVSIVFASPFYKLMIGDFSRRAEADSVVSKIKSLGYPDAWIVSGKGPSSADQKH